jgi:manganese oxidase
MPLSRRAFVKGAALGAAAIAGGVAATRLAGAQNTSHDHGGNRVVGGLRTDDFDPHKFLESFDRGVRVTPRADGSMLREYDIVAHDMTIEVAPGVTFNAWALNNQVPGPTLRAREGDRIKINFVNAHSHPHTLHFHGIHAAEMDGVPGIGAGLVPPGGRTTYEFDAIPHGVHLYHCHTPPLKKHIHKGLYGAYIVEPKEGWPPAREMVMVMNGFDTDFDGENDVYAVNSKAFAYLEKPIPIKKGELQRIFLVNITEFDPLNSFHLHGNFFHYQEIGHSSNPRRYTDNVALIQGERGMLEFTYDMTGRFMIHAHQSEFAELGWTSMLEVTE